MKQLAIKTFYYRVKELLCHMKIDRLSSLRSTHLPKVQMKITQTWSLTSPVPTRTEGHGGIGLLPRRSSGQMTSVGELGPRSTVRENFYTAIAAIMAAVLGE